MFACGWLAHAKLAGNQAAAHSILHQIAVDLRREMLGRVLKPVENLQSALVRESADCGSRYHYRISKFPNYDNTLVGILRGLNVESQVRVDSENARQSVTSAS